MRFLYFLSLLIIQGFTSVILSQELFPPDANPSKNSFINIDYFNEIWMKSRDLNKDDAAGFANRAASKIQSGYLDEAYQDIRKAIEIKPDYGYPYLLKGLYFLSLNMQDSAETSLEQSLKLDSLNDFTLYYLGLTKTSSNDFKGAENYYNRIIDLKNNQYMGYYGLARLYLAQNKIQEGRSYLIKANKANPDFIEAVFSLGLLDYYENHLNSAESSMDKIIALNPDIAQAYFIKAAINLRSNLKNKKGLENINMALKLEPGNPEYLDMRIQVYIASGEPDLAFDDLTQIFSNASIKGTSNYIQGRADKSEMQFILNLFKEYKYNFSAENRVKLMEFILYYYGNSYVKAQEKIALIKKTDNNTLLDILLGMTYENQNNIDLAYDCFQRSVENSPRLYLGYLVKGILDFKTKNQSSAISNLEKVIEINDTIFYAYKWRGLINYDNGKYNEALSDFNYFLDHDSSDVDIRFLRATILVKSRSYARALRDLNVVPMYDDNAVRALFSMKSGSYTEKLGELNLAATYISRGIQAIHLKTECLYNLEKFNDLINTIHILKPAYFTNDEWKWLGYAYMQTGKNADAVESLNAYLATNNSDLQAYTWRGSCNYSLHKYQDALNDFNRCINLNMSEGILYYLRGMANLKLRKVTEACMDFKSAEKNGYIVPINYKDTCGN